MIKSDWCSSDGNITVSKSHQCPINIYPIGIVAGGNLLCNADDDDEDNDNNDDVDANDTGWVPRDARRSQERQGGRRVVRGQRVLVD